ncbi:MAG: glycerate 2-kinase [Thermoleophilaceae bacterium]|nr:glycerate 2-kinase [Thermoleophilaceae bacterium]
MRQSRWWLTAPVLVAPDKFKGTMDAGEVAAAIAAGVRDGGRNAEELPVADGGEGTADALLRALGGEWIEADASDPLGRPIRARFAMLATSIAVVEAAAASGLALLPEADRDAFAASTRGTGELIAAAADAGAHEVIVAVGGTATTDGGAGALAALDEAAVDPKLTVVCDVRSPFEHAAAVFGPQKGADPATVKRLQRRLAAFATKAPRDPRGLPLTGAGGGLSGGLYAHRNAKLVPGAPFVLDALGFDARMRAASFVVTGEGRLDEQTLEGKAAGEVAVRCRQAGVACHAVVGQAAIDDFSFRVLALDGLLEAGDPEALRAAGRALA